MSDNPTEKKESPGNFPEKDEETSVSLEDSDILDCALGFYFDQIVNFKKRKPLTGFSHSVSGKENISFENAFTKRGGISINERDFFKSYEKNTLFLNSLVPKITLYKTFYQMKNGKIISSTDIPFNLEATWSKDDIVRNKIGFDTRNMIQKILQKGGPGGVGIASFEWTSQGKNEGNLTLYKAKIKFVLQNISEMTVIRGRSEKGQEVTLLDILYPSSSKTKGPSKDAFDQYNVEDSIIKAVVGWNTTTNRDNKIKDYYQTTLRLSMYNHVFNFLDNGKIELTVDFTAGIEGLIYDKNKMNILINKDAASIKKDIEILQSMVFEPATGWPPARTWFDSLDHYVPIDEKPEVYESFGRTMKWLGPPGLSEHISEAIAKKDFSDAFPIIAAAGMGGYVEDSAIYNLANAAGIDTTSGISGMPMKRFERDLLVEKLQDLLREKSRSFLITILDKLIEKNAVYSLSLNEKSFTTLKTFISVKDLPPGKWKAIVDRIGPAEVSAPSIEPGSFSEEFKVSAAGRSFGNSEILDTEELQEVVTDAQDSLWTSTGQFFGMVDDIHRVPFIYLGDFINTCLNEALEGHDEIDLFFSPMTYIKYDQKLQLGTGTFFESKNEQGNIVKKVNTDKLARGSTSLENIPISFTSLFKWYEERIVSRDEKSMSLGAFFDNIFYHLIPMSVGTTQAPNAPKQNIVVTRKYFQTNTKITTNPSIEIEEFAKIYNNRENRKIKNQSAAYFNFYFGSIKQHDKRTLRGNKKDDEEKGIFHLYTNASHGFVKNIKFKRPDNPLLETNNLMASMESSTNQYIRHPYHATITMFGNNFFEPGSLVYIVPNYIGTNLSNNLYFKVGLGGYYRIIEIKSNIGPTGYETVLETVWESWPYEEK